MPTYSTLNNKKVGLVKLAVEAVPTYVQKYFKDNPKKKPTMSIKIIKDAKLAELRNALFSEAAKGSPTIPIVCNYMYALMSQTYVTLSEEWTSFDVVIANADGRINYLAPVDWKTTDVTQDMTVVGAGQATKADDLWLLMYCACLMRMALAADESQYIQTLMANLAKRIAANGGPKITVPKKAEFADSGAFCALVACLDMMLVKDKTSDWKEVRVGSLVMRHKDCTLLGELAFFSKTVGVDLEDIGGWMYALPVIKEYGLIATSPDELGKMDSYAPYQHGLKLVEKGYYSTTTARNLHLFIHLVGTLLGAERSPRARMIQDCNLVDVPINAIYVAYNLKETLVMKLAYVSDEATAKRMVSEGVEEAKKDAEALYLEGAQRNWKLTKDMLTFVRNVQNRLTQTRQGSIGDWLKKTTY